MEENNSKSNIVLIVIFVVMLGSIFFIPNVMKLLDKDPNPVSTSKGSNKTNTGNNDVADNMAVNFTNDLVLSYDGVTINEFDLTNGFTFTLVNSKTISITDDDHYFIELYDNNETLLERLFLYIGKSIMPNEKRTYNFSSKSFNKIRLVKKSISDYPYVDVKKNDNDEYILTCSGKDTYVYTFNKSLELSEIKYTYVENKADTINYMENAISYKNKAIELDMIEGIDATYQEGLNNFNFLAMYNLSSIKDNTIYNSKIYPMNTNIRVVAFQMNSQEYICK